MTGWSSIPPERDPWREAAREVVISCGAALYNLRLAIAVAGRSPSVWLLPGPDRESGLLTTVTAERTLLASVEVMPALSLIHISEPTRLGMISYAVFCWQ